MDLPTKVNITLSILSFLLATLSIGFVLLTLRQNNKILEANNRPYLALYTEELRIRSTELHVLVLRNTGATQAQLLSVELDPQQSLTKALGQSRSGTDFAQILERAVLAPNQSKAIPYDHLQYSKQHSRIGALSPEVRFTIRYRSSTGAEYTETLTVDHAADVALPLAQFEFRKELAPEISAYAQLTTLMKSL